MAYFSPEGRQRMERTVDAIESMKRRRLAGQVDKGMGVPGARAPQPTPMPTMGMPSAPTSRYPTTPITPKSLDRVDYTPIVVTGSKTAPRQVVKPMNLTASKTATYSSGSPPVRRSY